MTEISNVFRGASPRARRRQLTKMSCRPRSLDKFVLMRTAGPPRLVGHGAAGANGALGFEHALRRAPGGAGAEQLAELPAVHLLEDVLELVTDPFCRAPEWRDFDEREDQPGTRPLDVASRPEPALEQPGVLPNRDAHRAGLGDSPALIPERRRRFQQRLDVRLQVVADPNREGQTRRIGGAERRRRLRRDEPLRSLDRSGRNREGGERRRSDY